MRKIRITIEKDGTQRVEALDVSGPGCVELTRALEERLGAQAGERTRKPEFDAGAPGEEAERERTSD